MDVSRRSAPFPSNRPALTISRSIGWIASMLSTHRQTARSSVTSSERTSVSAPFSRQACATSSSGASRRAASDNCTPVPRKPEPVARRCRCWLRSGRRGAVGFACPCPYSARPQFTGEFHRDIYRPANTVAILSHQAGSPSTTISKGSCTVDNWLPIALGKSRLFTFLLRLSLAITSRELYGEKSHCGGLRKLRTCYNSLWNFCTQGGCRDTS